MKQNTQKINKSVLITISLALMLVFSLPAQASEINVENVVRYVNEARAKEGLKALRINEKLSEVATAKVNDMVANHYFAHTSPAGLTPWHWFEKVGYDYKYAGENLAINFTSAEAQQAAWMKSPTHKKNILNINYEEIGIAVAAGEVNGTLGIIAVQEFGTLMHPGVVNDKKDFAPVKDKAIPEELKFAPTVLSTGDQKVDQKINEELQQAKKQLIGQKNNLPLAEVENDFFWLVLIVVIILPIALVNVVFIGKLIGVPWFRALAKKGYETVQANHPRKYFKKLKVKDRGTYHVIKVRVVTA